MHGGLVVVTGVMMLASLMLRLITKLRLSYKIVNAHNECDKFFFQELLRDVETNSVDWANSREESCRYAALALSCVAVMLRPHKKVELGDSQRAYHPSDCK